MELFGDVGFDGVEADLRRRDADEVELVVRGGEIGLAMDRVAERHVDSEVLPVDLTGKAACGPEAQTIVLQAVVLDFGVMGVGGDFEGEEISQVEASCGL